MTRASLRQERQIARLIDVLKKGPMSGKQVSAKLHLSYQATMAYLQMIREEPRRARICGYILETGTNGGRSSALFELGTDPDVPYQSMRRAVRPSTRANIMALLETPHSTQQLMLKLGITQSAVSLSMRSIKDEFFIHHWQRSPGNPIPFYQAGKEPDAPRPVALKSEQRKQRAAKRKSAWVAPLNTSWAAALGV